MTMDKMIKGYGADLAFIHDSGFGELARAASRDLVRRLHQNGFQNGPVVDLGCGSGILAGHLADAGYDVLGIDSSDAMIRIARRRAPRARFLVQSFLTAKLPRCVAVTSIGEPFNYLLDERNDSTALQRIFK